VTVAQDISAVSNSADSRILTFEYEYLREFETEFKNILGCESGAHLGSIIEKNQR
jgi:dTDP-4-amino-4,6-dideoxygalactose transaminase